MFNRINAYISDVVDNPIQPDHGAIAGFVTENKKAFRTVLRELTLVLKCWGLLDGKIVAIDTNYSPRS